MCRSLVVGVSVAEARACSHAAETQNFGVHLSRVCVHRLKSLSRMPALLHKPGIICHADGLTARHAIDMLANAPQAFCLQQQRRSCQLQVLHLALHAGTCTVDVIEL